MNTPIGRDFKRSGRKTGLEFSFFGREFLIGLSIGLAVAFGLFVYQQRALQKIVAAAEAQQLGNRRRASLASAVNEGSQSLQAAVSFFANPRGVAWRIQSSEPCSLPTGAFSPTAA